LEAHRLYPVGELVSGDVFVTFRTAAEMAAFPKDPMAFLRNHQRAVAVMTPGCKIRASDDATSRYAEFLVTMIRGNSGAGVIFLDVAEILNVEVRPAMPFTEVEGWHVEYRGTALGWTVLKADTIVQSNCASEAAARNRMNLEISNASHRR
jgi:hypothetical protein